MAREYPAETVPTRTKKTWTLPPLDFGAVFLCSIILGQFGIPSHPQSKFQMIVIGHPAPKSIGRADSPMFAAS